jgi:hypothetical protein
MSANKTSYSDKFSRVFYFFPFQLLLLHIKRSHLVIALWILLFGITSQLMGSKYGLPYLFLYPEYLGEVNFWSYLIIGFSCGGFIMAFNMYSYILHGFKFRFIATVSRPYQKFSINNSIIPILFVLVYLYSSYCFQVQKEFETVSDTIIHLLGYLTGILVFVTISNIYFFRTNKDLFKISGKKEEEYEIEINSKTGEVKARGIRFKWREMFNHDEGWNVETYMTSPFKVKLARDSSHYDIELIKKVFYQNHLNASIFEVAVIISFLLLGSFKEYPVFLIPAGASIFLFLTIVMMVISTIHSWFRGWTFTFIIVGVVFLNFLSQNTELFGYKNFAYGLDYSNKLAKYDHESIRLINSDSVNYENDKHEMIDILNRWKRNVKNEYGVDKPPLVLFCASGGGIRSSLWTFLVMQKLDSATNGMFGKYCRMISGASGGMIGSCYYRELLLNKNNGIIQSTQNKEYIEMLSKDVLNPVAFCIATSDVFIRYQHFKDGPYSYTVDRGYMFEKTLNENLNGAFTKRLYDYKVPEENAEVPMVVFSPTIINHGRKLIISPLNTSYFNYHSNADFTTSDGLIEFKRFFKQQNSVNLRFSTALRMNATFPFVMPMVSMPTDPGIEIMDAGIRDNYGTGLAIKFIAEFKNWIENNTSGVIIVTTRDRPRVLNQPKINGSVSAKMSVPAANLLDNIFYTQDFDNDALLDNMIKFSGLKIKLIDFYLPNDKKSKVSLSWHLTKLEKKLVTSAICLPYNIQSLKEFHKAIEPNQH